MAIGELISRGFEALAGMLYPRVCEVCGRGLVDGEHTLCLDCRYQLPLWSAADFTDNEIHERVMRQPVLKAAAYCHYYKDSPYARLIQDIKYAHRPSLGREMGAVAARELAKRDFFDGIDAITVVPLHRRKLLRRGYNQSLMIARGVSQATGIPVVETLRCLSHGTQTLRGRWQRWLNARSIYSADIELPHVPAHALLIDDVITSGATIMACVEALHRRYPSMQVSVMALGLAR